MEIEISDMISFVKRLSEMHLPDEDNGDCVKLNDLRDDEPREGGETLPLFDGYIEVRKVHGV